MTIANWIHNELTKALSGNCPSELDNFYAHGTGGSYRLIFEPKGTEMWLDDGSEDGYEYTLDFHRIKFGWESRIGVESNYFEFQYELKFADIEVTLEEVIKDWEAIRNRF